MQEASTRRSNQQRTDATRTALIASARKFFVEKGYAETGTPEIVAEAQVTRGALYYHFTDKADLFRAVVTHEAQALMQHIEQEATHHTAPLDALMAGADAYFTAMTVPGRVRLLLLDGPSVLGRTEIDQIDKETGGGTLHKGLMAAMSNDTRKPAALGPLTELLSAAFDRAALAIEDGKPANDYKTAIRLILSGLLEKK